MNWFEKKFLNATLGEFLFGSVIFWPITFVVGLFLTTFILASLFLGWQGAWELVMSLPRLAWEVLNG